MVVRSWSFSTLLDIVFHPLKSRLHTHRLYDHSKRSKPCVSVGAACDRAPFLESAKYARSRPRLQFLRFISERVRPRPTFRRPGRGDRYLPKLTGTALRPQISSAYCLMVRSVENLPVLATFRIDFLVHCAGSA